LFDHTVSEVGANYIKQRDIYSLKAVSIQELAPDKDDREEPTAVPILNSYIESKPGEFNQRYSLLSNFTAINRQSGLQYRRASIKPGINIPYNLNGNLFKATANVQGDFYNLENTYYTRPVDNNFNHFAGNYRPLASLSWSLPLIKTTESNTIIIEPMANFITSTFKNNFNKIPNEDSSNSQLTQANLFSDDRFFGFDRNESGQRMSYGAKSSLLNSLGLFGLGLGQSYRKNEKVQDVKIRGFNDSNVSNIVGEMTYKSKKIFSVGYNFHLNESNYRNEVNEITASAAFDRISFYSNFLLIRANADNPQTMKQLDYGTRVSATQNIKLDYMASQNLITGKILSKKLTVLNDGCCISYGFTVSESNPTDFVKPERSYNINFTIKSL
jgi:LPS-assembly protein